MFTNIDWRPIYHLGDVCDSTHPETAEACLGPLRDFGVIIIKFELTGKNFWEATCEVLRRGLFMGWMPKENIIEYFSLNS